jgi:hypothetical protein
MKTIRNKKTQEIQRVEEKLANQMVGISWEYCPKSEWKKTNDKPTEKQVVDEEKRTRTLSKKQQKRMKLRENQRQ